MPTKGPKATMGKTKQVTYRMPAELYDRLVKIADSMFQPVPVVMRAAMAEYVKNHRPMRTKNTGLELKWPDVAGQVEMGRLTPRAEATVGALVEEDVPLPFGMEDTTAADNPDTAADTPLTNRKEGT